MFKKNIHWMLLFAVIAILSVWVIITTTKSFSMPILLAQLHTANPFFLFLAFFCMAGFIFFEAMSLSVLIEGLCEKKEFSKYMTYSAADIYFSAITPSATGGQPASMLFMMKDGISAARSTVVLLLNLMMYTFALLFTGAIVFIFQNSIFFHYELVPQAFIVFGMLALIGMAILFWLLLKYEQIIRNIISFFIYIGEKLHIIRNADKNRQKLENMIEQYKECSKAIQGKYGMLFKSFVYNVLMRLSQSFVTVFCYLALHGSLSNVFTVWSTQIYTIIGSNSVPIPGAIGVIDYLLIKGLSTINDITNAANLELLSRGISFYSCLALSIGITVIGYILRTKKRGN